MNRTVNFRKKVPSSGLNFLVGSMARDIHWWKEIGINNILDLTMMRTTRDRFRGENFRNERKEKRWELSTLSFLSISNLFFILFLSLKISVSLVLLLDIPVFAQINYNMHHNIISVSPKMTCSTIVCMSRPLMTPWP